MGNGDENIEHPQTAQENYLLRELQRVWDVLLGVDADLRRAVERIEGLKKR